MGKKDITAKRFMAEPEVFADVFNQFLYGGKQVIKPEYLHELDTAQIVLPYGAGGVSKPIQKQRDILKKLSIVGMGDGKNAYVILGIENQADIHYAMPVRIALYDSMQYAKQVFDAGKSHKKAAKSGAEKLTSDEFLGGLTKEDRLLPVITLVIYFGPKKWNAPKRISEMLFLKDKKLLKYVLDYEINLIEPYAMSDEEIDHFRTDMREIMRFVKYSSDKAKLQEKVTQDRRFRTISADAAALIKTVTNSVELDVEPDKEGKVNMCKALVDIKMEGHNEGKVEGKVEGRAEGRAEALKNVMKNANMTFEQAMKVLGIPASKKAMYKKLVATMS